MNKCVCNRYSDNIYLSVSILPSASKTDESRGGESWKRQLELAITWNRVDLAKTEIFTEQSMWKVGLIQTTVPVGKKDLDLNFI